MDSSYYVLVTQESPSTFFEINRQETHLRRYYFLADKAAS